MLSRNHLRPPPAPKPVLDDNCMLCLPNGERIKLNPVTMRMLFEVEDLAAASPATVSRCGMVYVTPDDMGWRPYVKYVFFSVLRCSFAFHGPPARRTKIPAPS